MKSVKDFVVGEEVFYFDPEEKIVESGYISQANKKAKMFVPYDHEEICIRVSDCLEYLYKEEDLPEEAFEIVSEEVLSDIEGGEDTQEETSSLDDCINTENSDIVIELSIEDSGLDAVNHIIEYSKAEGRPIVGQIIFSDKSKQFVVAVNGIIDSCTDDEEEAISRVKELKSETEEENEEETICDDELNIEEIKLSGDDAKQVIDDLKELIKSFEKIQDAINELNMEYNKICWLYDAFKEVVK